MKHPFILFAIIAALTAGQGWGDMVDIGLTSMERSEFQTLKQMVDGRYPENLRGEHRSGNDAFQQLEFTLSDVDVQSLREIMSDNERDTEAKADFGQRFIVDFGIGSIPGNEFCSLNKLVVGGMLGSELASICSK